MVEAARQCASHPHDTARQQHLRHTVEELRAATTLAATPALRKTLVTRLEVSTVPVILNSTDKCDKALKIPSNFLRMNRVGLFCWRRIKNLLAT